MSAPDLSALLASLSPQNPPALSSAPPPMPTTPAPDISQTLASQPSMPAASQSAPPSLPVLAPQQPQQQSGPPSAMPNLVQFSCRLEAVIHLNQESALCSGLAGKTMRFGPNRKMSKFKCNRLYATIDN